MGGVMMALLIATIAVACQPVEPEATPTATRTPILPTATATPVPTSTPTPTPTITPTPTPTLPPGLVLPTSAVPTNVCPPLPADLYFLYPTGHKRGGELWVCLAEGGAPQMIPTDQTVWDYEVSDDRRQVTYVTDEGRVVILDRALAQETLIPTSGRIIEGGSATLTLTRDGNELIYLGWGVQLDPGPMLSSSGSGVLFSVSALSPTLQQTVLGNCSGQEGRPCEGFLLSPSEERIALADSRGIRLVSRSLDSGTPNADAGDTVPTGGGESGYLGLRQETESTLALHSWSPDGRWLLLSNSRSPTDQLDTSPAFTLLSTNAVDIPIEFTALCPPGCQVAAAWARSSEGAKLWLTWDAALEGCIASVDTGNLGTDMIAVRPENRICEAQTLALHPSSPIVGSAATSLGGLIAFLQPSGPRIATGIYALDVQAALRGVALLPETTDQVLWSAGGKAFLSMNAHEEALQIGSPATAALWDVQQLLDGAKSFTWRAITSE